MIDETDLRVISTEASIGNWTRVKRKDTNEKSIIDYVIMTDNIASTTKYLKIDEIGTHRLKGKAETDHNTMVIELDLIYTNKIHTETIYNTKNKKKWNEFQKELAKSYKEERTRNIQRV